MPVRPGVEARHLLWVSSEERQRSYEGGLNRRFQAEVVNFLG